MSYTLETYKWGATSWGSSSGEILWSVSDWSGLNYDTSLYDQSDFEGALQAAFDKWESVASVDFTLTSNPANADFDVFMSSLPGSTVGNTLVTYYAGTGGGPGQIIDSEVRLDSDETWDPFGATDLNFYAVALHEIGHAIGLGHVDDVTEIMNPYVAAGDLGDGDILGAQTIYGSDPGDVTVPDPSGGGSGSGSPVVAASGGGGAAGVGLIALILGLLTALIGGLGGGAVLAAAAALKSNEDTEDPLDDDETEDGTDLADVVPVTQVLSDGTVHQAAHFFFADDPAGNDEEDADQQGLAWL